VRGGVVLPNGAARRTFAPGEKQPVCLSAGRFWDAAKNLAALEAVAPRLPWPVRVAGARVQPGARRRHPTRRRGRAMARRAGAGELAAQFAAASIYALPARYEPFGLSALEAALSRLRAGAGRRAQPARGLGRCRRVRAAPRTTTPCTRR
jgi:glycogen(starch) synthase